ncbi:hypothetical protein [Sphingobacterium arenae]|uniref:Uncharacterized protein n=1 Tax=Sphingobacterium arenae TaxID=1280598 RepID=A0ABR7Y4C7_9SPHI|nr:hypothetical protein [Sphingobacterium arenae]MBD1426168.1 hypothetical protein [Sphingobacterium arenae]
MELKLGLLIVFLGTALSTGFHVMERYRSSFKFDGIDQFEINFLVQASRV